MLSFLPKPPGTQALHSGRVDRAQLSYFCDREFSDRETVDADAEVALAVTVVVLEGLFKGTSKPETIDFLIFP